MHMKKISLLTFALAAILSASGCGITDTPAELPVEQTITPYYFKLDHGHEYTYMVDDKKFSPTPYTLSMEMEGAVAGGSFQGKQMYQCEWESSTSQGGYYYGYYAMDENGAFYMGGDSTGSNAKWLDLVAPIQQGQKWSFPYGVDPNYTINAEISKVGFTACLADSNGDPVTYKDIIEVVYQGPEEKTVKWFARDHAMLAEWRYDSKGNVIHTKLLWDYYYED
jgi:hypothetical protein